MYLFACKEIKNLSKKCRPIRKYTLWKILPYVAPKKNTNLLATKIRPKMHHSLVLLLEHFTIFWCNSLLIMVQLKTNFCSQQISASFWCNMGQNFSECSRINLGTCNLCKCSECILFKYFAVFQVTSAFLMWYKYTGWRESFKRVCHVID